MTRPGYTYPSRFLGGYCSDDAGGSAMRDWLLTVINTMNQWAGRRTGGELGCIEQPTTEPSLSPRELTQERGALAGGFGA